MRAVLHVKNPNLSWKIVQTHFKSYGTMLNSSSAFGFNSNVFSSVSKTCEWPDTRLGTFNKCNSTFPFPGNITTIDAFVQSSITSNNIEDELLFSDRFKEQINVIDQTKDANIGQNISITEESLECTVHSCLPSLRKELSDLFPDKNLNSSDAVLSVLCLNHHTKANMATWDSSVAHERELLAQLFVASAKDICVSLNECGYWADFIDPYSGTPYAGGHTNSTLFETDPRMRHFGLQVLDLGCCKVLSHPQWRENVFTGLIFTDAAVDHPLLSSLGRDMSSQSPLLD